MSAVVTSLKDLATLIFQSLRLSMLLPALVFIIANALVIVPNLNYPVLRATYYSLDSSGQALLLVTLIAFVTYFLTVLNLPLIRCFEGYPLLSGLLSPIGNFLQHVHQSNLENLQKRRKALQELKLQMEHNRPDSDPSAYRKVLSDLNKVTTELIFFYPSEPELVAPTRLGNALAAAEDYANVLYKIDAVVLWPSLVPTLSKNGYALFIEREKGSFDFMINLIFLWLILGVEVFLIQQINHASLSIQALSILGFLTMSAILYRLSIESVAGWTATIRVSFDLYRDDLRRGLHLNNPDDYWDERRMWGQASALFRERHTAEADGLFSYAMPPATEPQTSNQAEPQNAPPLTQ